MKCGEYILVVAPDWYSGKRYRGKYCYEHRLVWEKEHGQPVPNGFVIHHKDGNKTNNDISNLELLEAKKHAKMHSSKGVTMCSFVCPVCKKVVKREARACKNRICFCSLKCCGLFNFAKRTKEEKEAVREQQFL